MEKNVTIITKFSIGLLALILLGFVAYTIAVPPREHAVQGVSTKSVEPISESSFTYQGKESVTALQLLSSHASYTKDTSGMVVSINGRKANSSKHEYWAFYVNGKLSSMGPADYVTKSTDTILWKIETY